MMFDALEDLGVFDRPDHDDRNIFGVVMRREELLAIVEANGV